MKKLGAFLVGLGLVAGTVFAAATNTATSVNAVGFVNKTLQPNKWILATCNFQKVGGGTNTLLDVFGTNQLAQNDALLLCDRVILWNSSTQTYQTWAQYTDGVFYKANNDTEWASSVAGNPEIPLGTAMWLVPGSGLVENKNVTFAGEVVSAPTQNVSIVSGWQMMGYPFSSDIKLQDTKFSANGAASNDALLLCDRVVVWLGSTYKTYALYTDGSWYNANNDTEWAASVLATNTLQLGEGFWYVAQSSIVWSEDCKYLNNLH